MRNWLLFSLLLMILVPLFGCDSLWDGLSRGALKNDIQALGRRHQLVLINPECHMIGTTRSGYCYLQHRTPPTEKLVQAFHLSPMTETDEKKYDFQNGCRTLPAFQLNHQTIEFYTPNSRLPELKLENGSAFDYMLLYLNPATQEICLQVSYAYG